MELIRKTWLAAGQINLKSVTDFSILAITIGALMPILSGLIYPTYFHMMPNPWVEWSRLIELPFVICELFILRLAIHRGFDLDKTLRSLPTDIKVAGAILFVGLFASSALYSKQPIQSLAISISTVIHILFGFAVYFLVLREHPDGKKLAELAKWCGIGLVLLAIFTAWRFLFPISPSQVPGGVIEWTAALPGFISVRHFGSWTGAITAMATVLVIQSKDRKSFGWPNLFFFLAMTMTLWSGTRGALFGMAASTLILIISQRRFPSWSIITRLIIMTFIGFIPALLLVPNGDPSFYLFDTPYIGGQAASEAVNALSSGRLQMWKLALDAWQQSPIFGWGSGSTFWQIDTGWTHTQPHNAIVQFLISWGLVGTLPAIWLLARSVVKAHKTVIAAPMLWPFLAAAYCLLAMSLQEGMLHYPRFIMMIFTLLAIIIAQGKIMEAERS